MLGVITAAGSIAPRSTISSTSATVRRAAVAAAVSLDQMGALRRVPGRREGGDEAAGATGLDERPELGIAAGDQRQVARALLDQRRDQVVRRPATGEAADEDGRAIGDVGDRL